MLETFIIDGNRVDIQVSSKAFRAELLEVTSFTDSCKNYIYSGQKFLKIQGVSLSEGEINETFQIIETKAEVLVLKSLHSIWSR